MSTQREFDLSEWERFREFPNLRSIMVEIEDLCITVAAFGVQDIPTRRDIVDKLARKVAVLPDEVRPAELGNYTLYLWATLMATRLRRSHSQS